MSIADILDAAMKERKPKPWTQSELAKRSGVPQPTISRILKGSQLPETGTLLKLAGALGVPFTKFLGCENEALAGLSTDEQILVAGFRAAQDGVRDVMLDAAKRALGNEQPKKAANQ